MLSLRIDQGHTLKPGSVTAVSWRRGGSPGRPLPVVLRHRVGAGPKELVHGLVLVGAAVEPELGLGQPELLRGAPSTAKPWTWCPPLPTPGGDTLHMDMHSKNFGDTYVTHFEFN